MDPLDMTGLRPLMALTSGRPAVKIGFIDGPVATAHADLAGARLQEVSTTHVATCPPDGEFACMHGTFVAGMLVARPAAQTPGLCPGCTLLVRPVFASRDASATGLPQATPAQLAAAIVDCVEAGARVINLSLGFSRPTSKQHAALREALDHAMARSVIVVAAAGNQGSVAGSAITGHPWVIPVVACDRHGRPLVASNLGASIGRNGLMAPGERIRSLGRPGRPLSLDGTSLATAFVTGAVALLWSVFERAGAPQIRHAVTQSGARSTRPSIVPPRLDAWSSHGQLSRSNDERH